MFARQTCSCSVLLCHTPLFKAKQVREAKSTSNVYCFDERGNTAIADGYWCVVAVNALLKLRSVDISVLPDCVTVGPSAVSAVRGDPPVENWSIKLLLLNTKSSFASALGTNALMP